MAAEQMPNASFSTTIIEKCDTGTILDVAIPSFRFGWMELFNDDNQPSTLTPRKLSSKICSPICCRMMFGGPSGCGGHMLTLNQHCNTYMESFGDVVQGHFGLAVFSESSFDSVKAFFHAKLVMRPYFMFPRNTWSTLGQNSMHYYRKWQLKAFLRKLHFMN